MNRRRSQREGRALASGCRAALALLTAISTGAPGLARAQAPDEKGRVVTISEVTIVGRIQKPIAAVDVSRMQPKLTLAELRQPFLQRIEEAIYHAPF
jgi:hypothetical protein